MNKKITTHTIRNMKNKKRISMLTAYDYPMAKIIDESECEMILVGDSLGNVVLGYENTTHVTMEDMIHHSKAVARGTKRALIVTDMPFISYHLGVYETIKNAGRIISEGNANAVKLEGGSEIAATVKAIVQAGIPVVGHLGLTPQHINQLGGYFIQGKTTEAAEKMIEDAKALEKSGVFCIVLECVPKELAKIITECISIPTIGIGAGKECDGQVLVSYDMIGLFSDYVPFFVKQYSEINKDIKKAVDQYVNEVREGEFPDENN